MRNILCDVINMPGQRSSDMRHISALPLASARLRKL